MVSAMINGVSQKLDYILQDKDRVSIMIDQFSSGPRREWADAALTAGAKSRILTRTM